VWLNACLYGQPVISMYYVGQEWYGVAYEQKKWYGKCHNGHTASAALVMG
jgi:hypothetical protein